ncbi:hypothetical protein KXV62_001152 [Aspergillus fumigatus]|nr:hypothetical protein KXX56_009259 [Aspergillus fumigatus]KAH2376102.1 hypothetical protein KXV62_001152 [Aspergillus fumigatus]
MSIDSRVSTGETGCADAWRVVDFEKPKLPENLQPLISDKFGLSDLLTELGSSFAMWDILERTYLTLICQLKISWFSFQKTIASFCSLGGHGNSSNRNQMRIDLVAEIDSIKITVAELSDVSEQVTQVPVVAREIDTLKEELLRRQNRLILLQSAPANPYSTNLTIRTSLQSTSWQNATKQSKNTELPNNSSSQHAQSLSDTYGSPPNAARRLKVIDLINISSNQHAQCAPYATASPNAVVQSEDLEPVDNPSRQQSQCPTGPSTPPVSHAPSSACTPNTDAIYSSTATDEQASLSSTALYCTAEETSGLGQPHLELQGQASPQCEGTGDCNRPTYFLQTLRR